MNSSDIFLDSVMHCSSPFLRQIIVKFDFIRAGVPHSHTQL